MSYDYDDDTLKMARLALPGLKQADEPDDDDADEDLLFVGDMTAQELTKELRDRLAADLAPVMDALRAGDWDKALEIASAMSTTTTKG